ncbi:hypothetical protein [Bifidobacterium adolescentis]
MNPVHFDSFPSASASDCWLWVWCRAAEKRPPDGSPTLVASSTAITGRHADQIGEESMNGLWVTIAGWAVTIGVSVAGWVITGRRAANSGKTDTERFERRLSLFSEQLDAMRDSSDSLHRQVNLLERKVSVPDWVIEHPSPSPNNVMFVIRNRNTFDAYDVRLEADGCEPVVLGDMAKGSSRKFEFVAAVLGRADNVIISWLDSPQATERMGLPMAMPERR